MSLIGRKSLVHQVPPPGTGGLTPPATIPDQAIALPQPKEAKAFSDANRVEVNTLDRMQALLSDLKTPGPIVAPPLSLKPNLSVKPLPTDPALRNLAIFQHNLSQRIADLTSQKKDLIKDLANPRKAPEAKARLALLDRQITVLGQAMASANAQAKAYVKPNLSVNPLPTDPALRTMAIFQQNLSQRMADMVSLKNDLIKDLADPRKAREAEARLALLDLQISMLVQAMGPANAQAKAYVKPNLSMDPLPTDPALRNLAIFQHNLSQRMADLTSQKNDLIKDLADPRRAPEANARLVLLDRQITMLGQAMASANAQAKGYVKPNLSVNPLPTDPALRTMAIFQQNLSQRMADLVSLKNDLSKDLANPQKAREAEARMALLDLQISVLVQAMGPANAQAKAYVKPNLSMDPLPTDPALRNLAIFQQNLSQRVSDLVSQKNDLLKNLADPRKALEANARLALLDRQITMLGQAMASANAQAKGYVKPNLSMDPPPTDPALRTMAIFQNNLSQRMADMVSQKNDLIKDLANPQKAREAEARLVLLDQQIRVLGQAMGPANAQAKAYVKPNLSMDPLPADPALIKLAITQNKLSQQIMDTFARKNALIKDLASGRLDPAKGAAELTKLDRQIEGLETELARIVKSTPLRK